MIKLILGLLFLASGSNAQTSALDKQDVPVNYFKNPGIEQSISTSGALWSRYADAAGVSPVDATGGSPNAAFTVTRSTSTPIRGASSLLITKDANNRQGHGVSFPFSTNGVSRTEDLCWEYEGSANYTGSSGSEYLTVYIYDITNSALIATSNVNAPQGSGNQCVTWASTTSTSYRVAFHVAGTGTSAWTYKVDSLRGNPSYSFSGAALSDWTSYTPTFSGFGTVTNINMWYSRVGQNLKIRGSFTVGTTTATGATMTLPSGLVVSSSFLNGSFEKHQFGYYTNGLNAGISPMSNTNYTIGGIFNFFSVGTSVQFDARSSTSGGGNDNATTILNAGDVVLIQDLTIPIEGWSSDVKLSNSRVEYVSNSGMGNSDDSTSFVYDANGNQIPATTYTAQRAKRVRFKNPIQRTDTIQLQIKPNNSIDSWITAGTMYIDAGSSFNTAVFTFSSENYGISAYNVINSTDVDVLFGQYQDNSSTNWSASNTSRWRIVKYSNAIPVESEAAPRSELYIDTPSGHGATNTKIRHFTVTAKNSGENVDWNYASDGTSGASVTILKQGIYAVTFSDSRSGSTANIGISVNGSGTTNITSLGYTTGRRQFTQASTGEVGLASWTGFLIKGDVIRPHDNGTNDGASDQSAFTVTKVAN